MSRLDGAGQADLGEARQDYFSEEILFENLNWAADAFVGGVGFKGSPPVATFTIAGPTLVGTDTKVTISLPRATMQAMPRGELGSDTVLSWELVRITGGSRHTVLFGSFTVYESVTQ